MTEPDIDTAIDRAVRELMDVDTDAAFRARVAARLQRPAPRTFVPRLVIAGASAAALVAALLWMRPSAPETPPPTTVASVDRAVPPPRAQDTVAPPAQTTAASRADRPPRTWTPRGTAAPIPTGVVVATVADTGGSAIPSLGALEPIHVEPIAQTSIAPEAIVVAPLAPLDELQISPLEPRPARN